jgi:hypothetical protein
MSWTQGIQSREDLPDAFVKWADSKKPGEKLQYITWFGMDKDFILDYGDGGALRATFKGGADD